MFAACSCSLPHGRSASSQISYKLNLKETKEAGVNLQSLSKDHCNYFNLKKKKHNSKGKTIQTPEILRHISLHAHRTHRQVTV